MSSDDKNNSGPKTGLKINNSTSSVPQPPRQSQADFDSKANQTFNKLEDIKKRGWDLASKFRDQVLDKTLNVNKGPIVKNLEDEVVDQLFHLASEMNEDDNFIDGEGSNTICSLLMRCMLKQRDVINELAYKIDRLEKLNKIIKEEPQV
jgi:hypothetical protein